MRLKANDYFARNALKNVQSIQLNAAPIKRLMINTQ